MNPKNKTRIPEILMAHWWRQRNEWTEPRPDFHIGLRLGPSHVGGRINCIGWQNDYRRIIQEAP